MVKCSAPMCLNATYKKSPGITFHRFPKDENLRNTWIHNMKIENWQPSSASVICSNHFEPHLIDRSGFRTVLVHGAIPTILDPFDDHIQEQLINLQNNEEPSVFTASIQQPTPSHIRMDDELSQKICIKCVEAINNALTFRRASRKAEKALLSMKPMLKSKKKYEAKVKKKVTKKKVKKISKSKVEMNFEGTNDVNDDLRNDNINIDDFNNDDFINDEFINDSLGDGMQPKALGYDGSVVETLKSNKKQCLNIPNASSYKCSTCNKEFRMKTTYKAHMRFHTNYCVCESCGKRCRNNNQLQEHKRARHGLGRIHKCAYCEYSSATKEALVIHERRHTGERPYVCDHCGATFHRRSNLVQHIAIHLPEKNFQCDMCPKRLKSRKFLQIHKHNAHTGRRYGYLCAVCGRRFEKPNKVRAHTRRVHGVPDDQQPPVVRVQM